MLPSSTLRTTAFSRQSMRRNDPGFRSVTWSSCSRSEPALANDATWYGEPLFNYYSAVVGSIVPFELTYTLLNGAGWSPTTFQSSFSYTVRGEVDFAAATFPALLGLQIRGSGQLPPSATAQYAAVAVYEGGVEQEVSADAQWTIAPEGAASVAAGEVQTVTGYVLNDSVKD